MSASGVKLDPERKEGMDDSTQSPVTHKLEQQLGTLTALRHRITEAIDTLPPAAAEGWRGLAAETFEWRMDALRRDIITLTEVIRGAIADTVVAIATIHSGG